MSAPPSILLASFLAGVAPIQFLYRLADTQLSRITGWKRRNVAGNRSIILLDGINSINSERLNEEGIASIQQMALCDPLDVALKTKFHEDTVTDWKEQAILYILTGDILTKARDKVHSQKEEYLNDTLEKKFGIRKEQQLIPRSRIKLLL